MEEQNNTIDFSFLDIQEKIYSYSVLILLNRPIIIQLYNELKNKTDYVICADGAANRMYDNLDEENNTPDCIVGDFDSIRPEVQDFYGKKNVKLLKRINIDTTDLEKCIYVALEKISECAQPEKRSVIIILGASGGRIDHTLSAYSTVFKYIHDSEEQAIDIFMLSKSSMSVYLKAGSNKIITTALWENRDEGYSVIPIFGNGRIEVTEDEGTGATVHFEKSINFGENMFFRKKHSANNITINLTPTKENEDIAFIYSFTTKFHNKS